MAFRLDANKHVASGHMMRCAEIAKEIVKQGHSVVFFLAENLNTEYLDIQMLPYIIINGHWDNWDVDIDKMIMEVKKEKTDILVVDSYFATANFLATMNQIIPVFMMDDYCNRRYNVSAALHYSEFPEEHFLEDIYRGSNVKVFRGMQFAPLRAEFTEDSNKPRKKQILITTGGTDPYHISLYLARLLTDDEKFADWNILVICGRMNNDYASIKAISSKTKNLTVLKNVSNMAERMRESEIAVSAGGITIYELCCSATAIVGFAFSDDQTESLERFAKHGVLLYAGDARKNEHTVVQNIYEMLIDMMTDSNKRCQLITNSARLTDGLGAGRIAQKIIEVGKEKH